MALHPLKPSKGCIKQGKKAKKAAKKGKHKTFRISTLKMHPIQENLSPGSVLSRVFVHVCVCLCVCVCCVCVFVCLCVCFFVCFVLVWFEFLFWFSLV